jgi:hypothetical protein
MHAIYMQHCEALMLKALKLSWSFNPAVMALLRQFATD